MQLCLRQVRDAVFTSNSVGIWKIRRTGNSGVTPTHRSGCPFCGRGEDLQAMNFHARLLHLLTQIGGLGIEAVGDAAQLLRHATASDTVAEQVGAAATPVKRPSLWTL